MIWNSRPANPTRRQRRAAGRGIRRVSTVLAGFLLALAGLATPAHAAADLSVLISPQTTEVSPGQVQDIGILVNANADVNPASVRAVVTLPEGVRWVSPGAPCGGDICPAGPCEAEGATVTCTVTNPAAIEERAYNFSIKVRFDAPAGATLTIPVTATSEGEDATPANNTSQTEITVIRGTDIGLKVEKVSGPAGPRNVVKYTYVIHNYGPATLPAVEFSELTEPLAFGTDGFTPTTVSCISETSPAIQCAASKRLAPGQDFRATRTVSVPAGSKLWGQKVKVTAGVSDLPAGGANSANNAVTFELDFTRGPGSGSPSPTGTADGGSGGGLPTTGAPTLAIAATGVALLIAGAGALLLTRRRVRAGAS